jgi:hypothetical protein
MKCRFFPLAIRKVVEYICICYIPTKSKEKMIMTTKEKTKLIKQAGKLYTLGLTVEKRREKLRRLAERNIPYDSPQMEAVRTGAFKIQITVL